MRARYPYETTERYEIAESGNSLFLIDNSIPTGNTNLLEIRISYQAPMNIDGLKALMLEYLQQTKDYLDCK